MKHTPGPWEMMRARTRWEVSGQDTHVCDVFRFHDDGAFDESTEHDARLIAAAPEMLEVLKALKAYGYDDLPYQFQVDADTAIAKAEGTE